MKILNFAFFLVISLLFTACEEPIYTPKPRGYPKIAYPERSYQGFQEEGCNFTFQYPKYAQIVEGKKPEDGSADCWFDLYMPIFDSKLYCTYYKIKDKEEFATLWNDGFNLANKHNVRADYIEEVRVLNPNGVGGFAFDIKGPAASPFQFFLTDSTQHFIRASLYFNTQVRQDSMAPVYEFVIADVMKMIETFEWED